MNVTVKQLIARFDRSIAYLDQEIKAAMVAGNADAILGLAAAREGYVSLKISVQFELDCLKGEIAVAQDEANEQEQAARSAAPREASTWTTATEDLFRDFAYWANEFGGNPWVEITKEQRGNLSDLKRRGLLTTAEYEPGESYVIFTPEGKKLAEELGYSTENWG